jgi:acid phosphatase type 7
MPPSPVTSAPAAPPDYPPCVEHGIWTPIPVAPPPGALRLRLRDVDRDESRAAKRRGVMTFHMTGCTGHYDNHVPQTKVAEAMARQAAEPHCYGGAARALAASFFFHLGDIVYKGENPDDAERADQQKLFAEQFYAAYAGYPRNIFAIPGNHDSKDPKHPERSPMRHFLVNFCAVRRQRSPDAPAGGRATMIQPYAYWLLQTPLAYVIGLYTNDVNGGQLDDPQVRRTPQYDWLVRTLKAVRKKADRRAVLLALHYPPYSGAANFLQRGDPNLGPTPRPLKLEPLGVILRHAFRESRQYPDAVLSAHAHHYQRITYTHADGRQTPYLIVGSGGHTPTEGLAETCDKKLGVAPALPADVALPPGLSLPSADRARLVAYNDRDFGFVRLTVDAGRRTLVGEFFAAYSESRPAAALPAPDDSFTLDLKSHTVA